jgi:hypothetical protein
MRTSSTLPIVALLVGVAALVPWNSAHSASALGFDGNDIASIPDSAVFHQIEGSDRLTIEAWINPSGYPQNWFPIVDKYRAATDFGWSFQLFGGAPAEIQFVGGIGPTVRAAWIAPLNTWSHVAFSYDRSVGLADFYVNGSLLSSVPYSTDIQTTGTDPLYIGYGPSGGDEFAQGGIDEVRLWGRALTATEIAANYNRPLSGSEAGLVGYWQLDEGFGTIFRDATVNANHGALGAGAARPTWLAAGAPLIPEPSTGLFALGLSLVAMTSRTRRNSWPTRVQSEEVAGADLPPVYETH